MRTAEVQGPLWGARAEEWALVQEPYWRPLYERVLSEAGVAAGATLLDVGCGGGTALEVASALGAAPAGLDASTALVAIARRRLPGCRIEAGDAEALPFDDSSFDVVCSFNALQFVGDRDAALRECARVCRPGGAAVVLVWADPQHCDLPSKVMSRILALLPPSPPSAASQPALHLPGVIAGHMRAAGFAPTVDTSIDLDFVYPDVSTAIRAVGAAPPVVRAERQVGAPKVLETLRAALLPFLQSGGAVRLRNRFRYVIARR
ncbi:MAG TPA: class I SAM-dependent methyltransferase [Caulobacteraceae bacterium]|nr:class I SAM-dependent methyltransferase [Caulobacteraceae bacterium]